MKETNRQNRTWAIIPIVFLAVLLFGCASCSWNVEAPDYTPVERNDWAVSTPEAEGIDRELIDGLYQAAAGAETVRAVLVVVHGKLIAEAYFNDGHIDLKQNTQSITKSIVSALAGIAIDDGLLTGIDQKMIDFFPEFTPMDDSRKEEITIRQLLQYRAGYPWEETSEEGMALVFNGFRPGNVADVPLVRDPGTGWDYSNLSAHIVGMIVARAADMDLLSYAQERLFDPLGIEPGPWTYSWDDYRCGWTELSLSPRDMARFGRLYLDGGTWNGEEIVPSEFVDASLTDYTHDAWYVSIGRNVRETGYGYLWWSARSGNGRYSFAWGHGGQQIALIQEHDMVVVVAADPLYGQMGADPWKKEKENLNLVGDFIATLPGF